MKNKFLHDQRKMDRIYNPVGVTWEVAADTFSYLADRDYFEKGSGLLKAYNEKMTALQNAYRAARGGIEKNTCYVFVLNYSGGDNDRNTAGFMPRGKQFGYIFLSGISKNEAGHVIAHELGHGLWKLKHTFDDSYGKTAAATEGTTDNLMDYNKGAHLAKWQWDVMREPAIFDGVFDSDQEGMMAATSSLLPGDVQRYNTSEFFRMLRLSITNGFEFTSRSFVSPFIGPGASNLRLGANNYTRLGGKRSSKNLTKEIIVENEKLFVNGWEINTANELEAGLLRNFLTGEEKDIYGIDTKKVRINGEEIDFTKIIKTSEDILIALVNNNNYSTLNFYERSIIDIPIIQWKLGYFHAASLLRHWMMGTGATVNLDEQNLIELLDNSNVFQKHLKDAVNVIEKEDNNIDIYKIDRPGVVFRAIHETLEKGEKNIEVKLSEEYKPNDGGINRFYTHLITEKDAVTLSGDITGEDFTASIGAVAIQFYFEGNLEIRGIDNAYLFGNVYYRFFDGFNFIDEKFNRLISQPLGTWDFDIFSPNLQGPSVGFTTQNKDFNSLYKKYGGVIGTTIGISPNFMIYSKYRKLEGWWEFNFISNLISEYCRVKKAK